MAHLRLFHYIGFFTLLPFELFIGLRYTRAKRRNHFISFISLISILGMALGVMALIVVLRFSFWNAPAHDLFAHVSAKLKDGVTVQQDFAITRLLWTVMKWPSGNQRIPAARW